jgi:DNA-binding HxlR family transcriptional regulator/putative sterol carrier protein
VVRELLLGPKRFTDLRSGLPSLSPDVLTQRLRDLGEAGVVERRKLDPPAGAWVYELTPRGRELEQVVIGLGRWGALAPFPPGEMRIGVDSTVLALKTLFEPDAAGDLDATYELRLDGQRFTARIAGGELDLARGGAEATDATIEAAPGALTELLWTGLSLAAAVRSGRVRIEGSRRAVARFVELFPLPAAPE